MFSIKIMPRFSETDVLGHINNTVVPVWFEAGRADIFKIFVPDLSKGVWNLIMAHMDVDYVAQIYLEHEVEIRSYIQKVGNSSFTIYHEAWQEEHLVAKGSAILVHFDFQEQKSKPIPDLIREKLEQHLRPIEEK